MGDLTAHHVSLAASEHVRGFNRAEGQLLYREVAMEGFGQRRRTKTKTHRMSKTERLLMGENKIRRNTECAHFWQSSWGLCREVLLTESHSHCLFGFKSV